MVDVIAINKFLFTVFFILAIPIYGQEILPDKNAFIDSYKLKLCLDEIDKIDSMDLSCDTVFFQTDAYKFVGIYYDNDNHPRKYLNRLIINDGSHDDITIFAYYNTARELIYFSYDNSYHCGDRYGRYYISEGCIIDFDCYENCECCEKELTEEEISLLRPVIGDRITKTVDNMPLTNFIDADTLIKILKEKDYSGYEEFQ